MTFLHRLLELYSPSGQEQSVAEYLQSYMTTQGFRSWIDEVGNVIGEIGQGEEEILLLGHIDTVPGYIPVKIQGDEIFGRGAVDAKGALVVFITAALKIGVTAKKKITVIGAVDEENDSKGAYHILNKFKPQSVIIGEPSGHNGITLGYKGSFKIKCHCIKAQHHGAHDVSTSCEELVAFWNRIHSHCQSFNEGKRAFDRLDPSLQEFQSRSDGFCDTAECGMGFRTPLDFSMPEFRTVIEALRGSIEIEYVSEVPAFKAEKNNRLVRAFVQAIRTVGEVPKFKLKTGTSDMNIVGPFWNCPIVAYGPGDSSLDHTPEERLNLLEFSRSIQVLQRVLEAL
ncbi:MAG: [LysW]-lysine hydrolase [candidate division KSB1 bacterium]|nr:[LysW]-lysine hydrolase [candidate division KSB1 bacterium]